MKIGVLVGKTEDGGYEYIGKPGDVDALDAQMRQIVDAKGVAKCGKTEKRFVKVWLDDASRNPIKAKKCC